MNQLRELFTGAVTAIAVLAFPACAGNNAAAATTPAPARGPASASTDTTGLIPPGLGSLHQEDISISVSTNGLILQAMPLSDDFIRTLSPDSYNSIFRIRESKRASVDTIAKRTGATSLSLWQVTFRNVQPGEAPFAARDVIITNQGRDFKPIDVIGITPGFGEQRVKQNQTHVGILVYEAGINANQPLTVTSGNQVGGTNWQSVIQRVEAERARIRARAAAKQGGTPSGSLPR